MKKLTLIRHAESGWGHATQPDFERTLSPLGLENAPEMGKQLKASNLKFDKVFASPAVRALTTAQLICDQLGYPSANIEADPLLYTFDSEELLRVIEQVDDEIEHAAFVCHNPAITLLVNDLTFASIDNVPTCGVVQMVLDIEAWVEIRSGVGRLLAFDYPKGV